MTKPPTIKVEIIHIDGPLKGAIQEFYDPLITIGRHPDSMVTFPGDLNDLSRRHAEIRRDGNRFMLVDHSTNGTQVNGKYVKEHILKDGDVLTLSENGPKISFLTTIVDESEVPRPTSEPEVEKTVSGPHIPPEPVDLSVPPPEPAPEVIDRYGVAEPEPPAEKSSPAGTEPNLSTGQIPVQTLQKPFIIQFGATIKSFNALPITLGSGADCDFIINHPAIMGEHAQIYFSSASYHIKDLTGRGLVSINSRPIQDSAPMPADTCISLSSQGPLFQFIGEGRLAEIDVSQQPAQELAGGGTDDAGATKKKSFWPFKKK